MKQVYADFNEIEADGLPPLACAGSVASIAELKQELRDGEEVCFTDGAMFAVGRVHRHVDGSRRADRSGSSSTCRLPDSTSLARR